MRVRVPAGVTALGLWLAVAPPALGHHGWSGYDASKELRGLWPALPPSMDERDPVGLAASNDRRTGPSFRLVANG